MKFTKKLENYLKDIIREKRKGWFPDLLKFFLLGMSWIYRFAVACRNWVYDKGWMRRYVSPVPLVISIGNIVAGGTGKTPLTLLLAQAFYDRFSIAILSRGYRSKAEKLGYPIILCEGEGPLYPAAYSGDEPYIFANRMPKAHVIVGGNRQKASCVAAKAGVQVILLDDGLQHRCLVRDFDIVVVDACDPFGHNHFLPRGFLREDISALSRANLIILNHISDQEQFHTIKNQISSYSAAPVIGTKWQVESLQDLQGNEVGSLHGRKVGMFCGIANPDYFRQTLEEQGAIVVDEHCVPDHERPTERELKVFARSCLEKGAERLLCTEKDQVKLGPQMTLALPIAWLKMEMKVVEGQDNWEAFLKKAESKLY